MEIDERHEEDVVVLILRGELRACAGGDTLRERVEDLSGNGHRKIVVDLAEVSCVDSAGLGELVACCTTVSGRKGKLKVMNLRDRIHDLLGITRLFALSDDDDDDWPTGAAGATSLGAVFNIRPKS